MIQRFSLYRELDQWKDDICEDPNGRWVRWRDSEPYVTFALGHGFVPEQQVVVSDQPPLQMVDSSQADLLDEDDLDENDEVDVYEMITGQARERFDEVE